MTTDEEQIGRLYDYLSALAQEVYAKPVRHVSDHDLVVSPEDVPEHPAVRVGVAAGNAWLRVGKVARPRPPALPPELAGVLYDIERDDPYTLPLLPDDLAERADVAEAFHRWRDVVWSPWADGARAALAARDLYETLFKLRQRMRADEATHELVFGHGVLGWQVGEERICHPLLISRVRVAFDDDSGELSLVPDDALPVLELDCLQGLGIPNLEQLNRIGEELRDTPAEVWADEPMRVLYRRILAPLGLDDRLVEGPSLPPVSDTPVLAASWRLVLRRRRVRFLRFFEQLKGALEEQETLPAPLLALVGGSRPVEDAEEWEAVGSRLLMPLPANDEQERIARKLAAHAGVTVQGPPGTGKSHTIANLVSHLVAHGKRVLVTSHKDQALAVLRDKIPAELRDLSLAVLGGSSGDLTRLQRSVQAITAAADSVDEARETVAISELRERLETVQEDVALLRKRLRKSLEKERESLDLGDGARPAREVAEWLAEREGAMGQVPDALGLDVECPLPQSEVAELFALAAEVGADDAVAATLDLPPAGRLPTGARLAGLLEELRRLDEVLASLDSYVEDYARVDAFGEAELARLAEGCQQGAHTLAGLQDDWLLRLREQVAQDRQWLELWGGHAARLRDYVRRCGQLRATISGSLVEPAGGVGYRESLDLLSQLRARFEAGKKGAPALNRGLAQFLRATFVDGEPPRTVEDVDKVMAFLELRRVRETSVRLWTDEMVMALGAPQSPLEGAVETWIDARVQQIHRALEWEAEFWPGLRSGLVQVVSARAVPGRVTPADLQSLGGVVGGLQARIRQRSVQSELDSLAAFLTAGRGGAQASPLWAELLSALSRSEWERWDTALATSARLVALRPKVARLESLLSGLAAVAPLWAQRIRASGGDLAVCGDPSSVGQLWKWRQTETWLRGIIEADDLAGIQRRLDAAQEEQRRLVLELTRRSAWLEMKRNLGAEQRQALVGWLQTLRKIGRGTGVGAPKWRAEAQRLMPLAMGAVPVWIMPYYRVAESFDPSVAPPFDVVIVDESSQCDVFALGLLGLGHKVVVVGDDKQISPSAVGVRRDRVDELIRTHLPSFPNALLLDLESSLYDASARLFPGVVRLREHFRCLPRIISFSSENYYGDEIQPLREEVADRLPGPVVQSVFVADGMRVDLPIGNVNEAEADALVDHVVECCSDPAYDGRTMGVISLIGTSKQAAYIDAKLLAKLGPEEYERRLLRCGDAYGFQGDERDVMFISVVADDDRAAFTGRRYEQRLNVAASRARDQLFVFHSVSPSDLAADDQRARLIRYASEGVRSEQVWDSLESRCESDFERRVLRLLQARGYQVSPQHSVGNLRIDLVVRGSAGSQRLAIECDGDKFHGPEQWEDDLRRQAVLERLGWRFWRVRGSVFYRAPEAAMASLWPLLDRLDIHP